MKNHTEQSPYVNMSNKASLVFDYETNDMKVEDKDDLQTKIYYFDKNSKTYSKFIYNFY